MKLKSIKIHSDGTRAGTHVLDSNGNILGFIQSIEWKASVDKPYTECYLKIVSAELDVEMKEAKLLKCKVKEAKSQLKNIAKKMSRL